MNGNLHLLKESLGWVAMAAFSASYLCRSAVALRRAQAGAATLWIVYGVAAGTPPVIVSNVIVAFMAVVYPWIKARPEARRVATVEPPMSPATRFDGKWSSMNPPVTTGHPGLVGAVLGGWCPPSAFAKPARDDAPRL